MNKVLITGTSRGIGKALSLHFLEKGWEVFGCSRSIDYFKHPNYHHFKVDLAEIDSVNEFVKEIFSATASLNTLVNNAAVSSTNLAMLMSDKKIKEIFNINLIANFILTRNMIRLLAKNPPSMILNVTSPVSKYPTRGLSAYGCTKAAIDHLTLSLSEELRPLNIAVNSISPGLVDTDLLRGIPNELHDESLRRFHLSEKTSVQKIADKIDFLLQQRSTLYTGNIVSCDQ